MTLHDNEDEAAVAAVLLSLLFVNVEEGSILAAPVVVMMICS